MSSQIRTALIALALVVPGSSFAATTGTPDPFAAQVEQKCTEAANGAFRRAQVIVDPSGTETYGMAIVVGRSTELKSRATSICVVDRKTGKVELGSPLGTDVVRVRGPKKQGQENGKPQKHNMMQNNAQGGKTMNNNSNNDAGGQDDDGSDDGQ